MQPSTQTPEPPSSSSVKLATRTPTAISTILKSKKKIKNNGAVLLWRSYSFIFHLWCHDWRSLGSHQSFDALFLFFWIVDAVNLVSHWSVSVCILHMISLLNSSENGWTSAFYPNEFVVMTHTMAPTPFTHFALASMIYYSKWKWVQSRKKKCERTKKKKEKWFTRIVTEKYGVKQIEKRCFCDRRRNRCTSPWGVRKMCNN